MNSTDVQHSGTWLLPSGTTGRREARKMEAPFHSLGNIAARSYNRGMAQPAEFAEMQSYVGFSSEDRDHIRLLRPIVAPFFSEVTEKFYEALLKNPAARSVFTGGDAQIAHQRTLLCQWLSELFQGEYDPEYHAKRIRIGTTHLRVGLPQQYMCMGMQLIWEELDRVIRRQAPPHQDRLLASLHKLIMLDLAVMLDSYKSSYIEQTRQTERSAVEARLTQSEHLAEIGKLAASLAHEIKNPLAGISGAIQIIGDGMGLGDPRKPIVAEIIAQIRRLDAAVCDLLQYARPAAPRKAQMLLSDAVRRVLLILQQEPALSNVTVEYDGGAQDSFIPADPGQIEQLLINLLINAAQASEGKGRIRVETEAVEGGVQLVVADSGSGMSAEVMERAFEPFYTTKARGTGLGLPICRQIVHSHGATIGIKSETGKGTTVTILFPAPVHSRE